MPISHCRTHLAGLGSNRRRWFPSVPTTLMVCFRLDQQALLCAPLGIDSAPQRTSEGLHVTRQNCHEPSRVSGSSPLGSVRACVFRLHAPKRQSVEQICSPGLLATQPHGNTGSHWPVVRECGPLHACICQDAHGLRRRLDKHSVSPRWDALFSAWIVHIDEGGLAGCARRQLSAGQGCCGNELCRGEPLCRDEASLNNGGDRHTSKLVCGSKAQRCLTEPSERWGVSHWCPGRSGVWRLVWMEHCMEELVTFAKPFPPALLHRCICEGSGGSASAVEIAEQNDSVESV